MKKFLNSFTWSSYRRAMEGILIMCFGLLLMTGGQVGIQVSENAPHWVPIPKLEQTWLAWVVVWWGFDFIFNGKITRLISAKVIYPILRPLLEPLSQHPIIQRLTNRLRKLQEKEGKHDLESPPE